MSHFKTLDYCLFLDGFVAQAPACILIYKIEDDMTKNKKKNPPRKLRNYLISPDEQLGLAIISYVVLFLTLAAQTLFVTQSLNGSSIQFDDLSTISLPQITILSFFVFSLIGGLILFLVNIYYTHKIYGSLYAVRNQIKKALNNEVCTPIIGRKGDKVQDLISLVNMLISKYQKSDSSES